MTSAWQHILETIEPNIQELQRILDRGQVIKPLLNRNKKGAWQVTLDYKNNDDLLIDIAPEAFNDRIEWAVEEIENWDAWRSSYDTWVFSSKDEAEKFITFYYLKWAST